MQKQKTIKNKISVKGKGLHTGREVNMKLGPSEADSGVTFIRTDLEGSPAVKAGYMNLVSKAGSLRCSSLVDGNAEVQTVEHLMAGLFGMELDNLIVEIDGNELPGLDGSSRSFVELIERSGIQEQESPRQFYQVREPIVVEERSCAITVVPSQEFKVSYTLDYNHEYLSNQFLEITVNKDNFSQISGARTFCLETEAEELKRQGFGKGANYENTLVIGKEGAIQNKLRYKDEFVRHKILDMVGDLYLFGMPIKGHIIALRSGHSLNVKLLNKLASQMQRYASSSIPMKFTRERYEYDINEIMQILPHRYPFLFVDRITHLEKGKKAVGYKNVTINDYFFEGHFPGRPVMPGVLMVEAMAQVGGVMMLAAEENRGKIAYFMSIDNVKFRKPVIPGDQIVFEVEAVKIRSRTGQVRAKAVVDGKVAVEGELMFALSESQR